MATPLATPFNVTTTASNGTVTVTWDDNNPATAVLKSDIAFLAKDTLIPYVPSAVGQDTTTTSGAVTHHSVPITPNGTDPTPTDLASNFIARVIDHPKDTTANSDSAPGLQVSWDANLSLIVQVGSHQFTLTKASTLSGIYRLPVSRENPFQITLDDVKDFAEAVGIGRDKVPTKWPNGNDITGSLNLYKLAVDTDRKLMALDIALDLNFEPIPGLKIKQVGLSVARTDGVHLL